jgi:HAD superfamily hydrolase (TIGR01509 family)
MLPFDLIIFDCDGVLVDSEVLSCSCLADIFRRHGASLSVEEVTDRFLGRSPSAIEAYWTSARRESVPPNFFEEYRTHLATIFTAELKPMPFAEDVLQSLDKASCVASSSDMDRLKLSLSITGLDIYFEGKTFNSEMVSHGKPAPDLFLHAARAMGYAPTRTLVIEDSITGVRAGKAAGMTVWGFVGGSHCHAGDVGARLASAGADRAFDSLAELLPA